MHQPASDATFAAFLQRVEPAVRQFLRRLCAPGDAEDVLQETLAKVWRLRGSFDARQNGDAWLMQAAFRCFCDHRRRAQRRPPTHGEPESTPAPAAPCPTELRDELQHRLAGLPPLERDLLLGFHAHGRSLRELAALHGLPLNTIKSHLHRARQRLHEENR
ncbi:MAG: RNA polymerase sigma factor [Planctomycetota bacterium]